MFGIRVAASCHGLIYFGVFSYSYMVLGWLVFRAIGPVGEPRSRVPLGMGLALLVLPFIPASGLFMEVNVATSRS